MKNFDFGKMRKSVKRAAAVVLSAAMIFTECLPAFAEGLASDTPDPQLISEETEKVTRVPAERSTGALDEVEEKSIVYFGTASLTAGESEWTYEIPLYRDGDLSEGETVVIHSLDMTALYGRDYVLLGEGRTENESEITLLEESVKTGDSEATTTYQYDSETGELSVAEKDEEAVEEVMPVEAEEIGDDQEGSAVKEEADLEEEQEDSRDEEVKEDEAGMEPAPAEEIEGAEQEVSLLGEAAEAEEAGAVSVPAEEEKTIEEVAEPLPVEEAVEAEVIEEDAEALVPEMAEEPDEAPEMLQADEAANAEEGADLLGADGEKLSLSMVKQLATGEQVRITQSAESTEFSQLLAAELMPFYLTAMKYSCEQIFTFAPGESEKIVTVKILDDDLSEGSETFSLVLCEAGSSAIVTPSSLSVIIEDDEEYTPSEISFTKDKYEIEDGVAKITLERSGQEQSLATVMVSRVDSETGEPTACAEAVFTPYSTEVEVELELAEATELTLTDFAGAEGGEIVEAEAEADLLAAELPSKIKFNGNNYDVRFESGNKVYGTIWDSEHYTPALEVGRYYLPTSTEQGGDFTYDTFGDSCSWKDAKYEPANNRGYCYWHSRWAPDKGGAQLTNCENGVNKRSLNAINYQYVFPDWEQTDRLGYHQQVAFMAGTGDKQIREDKFERICDSEKAVTIKNNNQPLNIIAAAIDNSSWAPCIRMYYYGTVCMYKFFNVRKKIADSRDYSFITDLNSDGTYSYINAVPANVFLKSGAQTLASEEKLFYTNPDEKQSNMVWELGTTRLHGEHQGVFGTIKGFEIKISEGDKSNEVIVNYPDDFFNWMDQRSDPKSEEYDPSYTKAAVDAEKAKVNNNRAVVPYDQYFIDFIEHKQKKTYTQRGFEKGYYQILAMTPKFDYNYVKVQVLAPMIGSGTGRFLDNHLSEGKEITGVYKTGDRLNLSAIAEAGYRVQGYEVSTNNGASFNTIRDTKYLVIDQNKDYIIRPCITEDLNYIEIKTNWNVGKEDVTISGLVPDYVLKGTELEGKKILDMNPKAETLRERVEPVVGKIYPISVVVNKKVSRPMVYYPVITDPLTNERAMAYQYYATGRAQPKDNQYTLSLTMTATTTTEQYKTLTGRVIMKSESIRQDGAGKRNIMLSGYSVLAGLGMMEQDGKKYVSTKTSIIDKDGNFTLNDMPYLFGGNIKVRLLVSNGLNSEAVFTVKIGSIKREENVGVLEMNYPYGLPDVTTVMYEYEYPSSHPRTDYRDNTIECYDGESIHLTAVVDANGRKIEKAVFTVYHADGKKSLERTAYASSDKENQFTCQIDDMLKNLYNGDYVTVYLVDKEKAGAAKIEIVYPERRTGLVFRVLNELAKPKWFDVSMADPNIFGQGKEPTVNVPMFGPVNTGAMSGNMGLNRVDWKDKKGFSLLFNFDALIWKEIGAYSIEKRQELAREFKNSVGKAINARREVDERTKDLSNLGMRAEQLRAQMEGLSEDSPGWQRRAKELNDIEKAKEYSKNIRDINLRTGRETAATINKQNPSYNFDVLFALDFEFVLNPKKNEYTLATCSATIGGSFEVTKTFYGAIAYVPVFMTLGGSAQVNVMMGGACPEGIHAVTAGDFNGYGGNITDLINQDHKFTSEFDLIFGGQVTVGAGVAGVLDVRGGIDASFQLQLLTPNLSQTRDRFGTILSAGGKIGFTAVIISMDINIVRAAWGTGNLRDRTEVSFFNNTLQLKGEGELPETEDDAALAGAGPQEFTQTIEVVANDYGGSVAENFVNTGTESATYKNIERSFLLEDAPEHVKPEIVDIGGGRFLMTFVGKRKGQGDESCLYYTVSDGKGSWLDPKPVDAADNTFDSEASVIRAGNKVVIAWVDADKQIDNLKNFKDQYNSLSISAAVYDIVNDEMSKKIKVSGRQITLPNGRRISDVYFDCKPVLTAAGDKVYCTFVTRDIDAAEDIIRITDITGLYSTVRQSVIDVSGKVPTATEPRFITVQHEHETDPLTYDYCTQSITSEGDEYILNAYSIDTDGDFKTADDKAVYLSITDPVKGESYYPFKVSKEDKAVTDVQLNKLGDEIYLTWLSEGKIFHILEVNELIESIYHSESLVRDSEDEELKKLFAEISKLMKATPSDASWIRESQKANIFNKEAAGENYLDFNETIYGQLAENDLHHVSRNLTDGRGSGNIDEYRLVSDADGNVFVFYTDYVNEYQHYGKELFGMQYVHSYKDSKNGGTEDYGLLEAISAVNRLTEPVQMTDFNALMDEFDVEMDGDTHEVYVMTNYMTNKPGQESAILHGDNRLAQLIFEPSGSVEVDEESVGMIGDLVSGENDLVYFRISNNGILDADGYRIDVTAKKDGKETSVYSIDSDETLRVNDVKEIYVPWTLPDDISDLDLVIQVTEKGTTVQDSSVVTYRVPYEESIEFSDVSLTACEGKVTVSGNVRNAGPRDAEAWDLQIRTWKYGEETSGEGEEQERVITVEGQQGLKSGEKRSFSFEFTPLPEDFDSFGILGIELKAIRDEEELASHATELAVTEPMVTVINGGEESVTLKPGTTLALEVSTAPWGDLSDDVIFYSDDENIAEVSDEGLLTAGEKGKTEVTVYYPAFGVYDSIEVIVSDSLPGSGSSETALQGPASARPMYGTWKAGADGTWTFVTSSGSLFKGWGYIRSGSSYDYYHMGADGTMDYGWYYDEKLKKWYYLNENHDGRFGAMTRGCTWIPKTESGTTWIRRPERCAPAGCL